MLRKYKRNRYVFRNDLKEWRKGFAYISVKEIKKEKLVSKWKRQKEKFQKRDKKKKGNVWRCFFFLGKKVEAYTIRKKGSNLRRENTYSENSIKVLTTGYERESPEEDITSRWEITSRIQCLETSRNKKFFFFFLFIKWFCSLNRC